MKITSFLLSLIWAETHLELLEQDPPGEAPMKFLGRPDQYATNFNQAQHLLKVRTPQTLSPPWTPRTRGQHFWTRYSGGLTNANVSGHLAWQKLVPFRAALPLHLTTSASLNYPPFELFFYPHGIAFVCTIPWEVDSPSSLEEATKTALDMRYDQQHRVSWADEGDKLYAGIKWPVKAGTGLSLDQLANQGMNIARTLAFGTAASAGRSIDPKPFSIVTILKGQEADLTKAPESNGDIQRALNALTGWQKIRAGAAALSFNEQVSLGLGKDAGVADVLYGQTRGRVIWYPSRFVTEDVDILYGLQCYHRNLVFASLQTESLCGLAQVVAERIQTGAAMSAYQREVATKAGGTLGLLYGGHQDTYRSFSPRRQIDDNHWVDEVNSMREYRGMGPLH